VLIHSAAGGVGQAALSVCQYLGAEIYATASSAKRSLVESLGVPADRIFDSRSHQWFDDIMTATGQQGVHVVLNSLAGKHQQLGLEALAPNGRFLEIGKMDVYKYVPLDPHVPHMQRRAGC
jgi:NADPH:quinone reductase-like Zn-dependent oxidoreductase